MIGLRCRRRSAAPERRDALVIMREATTLRNEMRSCTSVERADEILCRMRELAVEIGALPSSDAAAGHIEMRRQSRDGA